MQKILDIVRSLQPSKQNYGIERVHQKVRVHLRVKRLKLQLVALTLVFLCFYEELVQQMNGRIERFLNFGKFVFVWFGVGLCKISDFHAA